MLCVAYHIRNQVNSSVTEKKNITYFDYTVKTDQTAPQRTESIILSELKDSASGCQTSSPAEIQEY